MSRPILKLKVPRRPEARAQEYLHTHAAIREHLPLALHVHRTLLKGRPEGVSQRILRGALGKHCRCPRYREAMAQDGSKRHTLDGQPDIEVSEEHRARARKGLAMKQERTRS
jgi:sRNA-binding protein